MRLIDIADKRLRLIIGWSSDNQILFLQNSHSLIRDGKVFTLYDINNVEISISAAKHLIECAVIVFRVQITIDEDHRILVLL